MKIKVLLDQFTSVLRKQVSPEICAALICAIVGSGCLNKVGEEKASQELSKKQIKIGAVLPLTGAQATFGNSSQKGMNLAVDEINQHGGLLGKQLQLVILDDQSKAEEAAMATSRLISQEKVVSILGEIASSRSISMAPIVQRFGIPMISPGSTNPKLTELGSSIFRVCFIDPFQGEVMAKFARSPLKLKTIAVLTDIKSDYSVGLSEFFISTFKREGGEIVSTQVYNTGDFDFKSQLTAIRAKNPDGVFVPGSYIEAGLIARQSRELGIKGILLGGDDWDSPKLLEIAGPSIENAYFSNHFSEEDQAPSVQDFMKKYKAKFQGATPDGLSVLGYDAVSVFADAVIRAQSDQPKDVQKALAVTKDFQGVAGLITMDERRNARKPAVVIKIKEGRFKYETTVKP